MKDQIADLLAFAGTETRLAKFAGFDEGGFPLVAFGEEEPVPALSLVDIDPGIEDQRMAVIPLTGEDCAWLILGAIQPRRTPGGGKRELTAERELTLRCGKSSLTLSANGRVTLRGKQILSRAEGQNRVQGATVGLN